jgi:hypothetical protein
MKLFYLFFSIFLGFCFCNPSIQNKTETTTSTEENSPSKTAEASDYHVFHWQWEPKEKAFRVLIPQDWITDGGIFRIDPNTGGGAANAIEAKLDFTIKKDNKGTVMTRWFPDMYYFDARYAPAGQMGIYPTGSNYNGMIVLPFMTPSQFAVQVVLPYAHPGASQAKIINQKELPALAKAIKKEDNLMVEMGFTYAASITTIEYLENGTNYEEKIVVGIMNLGQAGAGMWKNRYTYSIRAPKGALEQYESIFAAIGNSITLNPQWIAGEIKGQMVRSGIMNATIQEINRIGQEITNHRQRTNEIIQNDMYLNLTGQEEYINPYTKAIEMGTNQWDHRWSSNSDFVIYSDDPNFDPNRIPELNHYEYKKSRIRKRTSK